jgi:hypothetical protein
LEKKMTNYFHLDSLLKASGTLVIMLLSLMTLSPQKSYAGDIGLVTIISNQCGKVTVAVSLNSNWKPMPTANKPTYKVTKILGNDFLDVATSDLPIITIDVGVGAAFKFHVTARSRQTGLIGITMQRKVGEFQGTAGFCSGLAIGEVRLRHEKTGKCMFGDFNDGGVVKTWTCWDDPNMAYILDTVSGNEVRLRHRISSKCVYGNNVNGGFAKNWICWNDPNMIFIKDPLPGTNRFRLRHKATNRCLYGGTADGDPVKSWGPCWDDPNMVWVLDTL